MPYTFIRIGKQFDDGRSVDEVYPVVTNPGKSIFTNTDGMLSWTEPLTKPIAANVNTGANLADGVGYQDLPTSPGPSVNVTFSNPFIGSNLKCLVTLSCSFVTFSENTCNMSFEVSGATTISASDTNSVSGFSSVAMNGATSISRTFLLEGISAGVNVFTAKYQKANNNTVLVERRSIVVQPLPVN